MSESSSDWGASVIDHKKLKRYSNSPCSLWDDRWHSINDYLQLSEYNFSAH